MSGRAGRAVLFDLDDTLYGYAPCNAAGLAAAHAVLNGEAPIDFDGFRTLHDGVRRELAERLAGQAASHNRAIFFKWIVERHLGAPRGRVALEMFDRYWAEFLERMTPAPGSEQVLEQLSDDHPLALVTNHTTDIQLRKLERLGFGRWFSAVVTSEEIGVEKPDPRAFRAALEALGVDSTGAVMVGDNPDVDIAGAKRAGLGAVLSTEFHRGGPSGGTADGQADRVVGSVGEVPAALAEVAGESTRRSAP